MYDEDDLLPLSALRHLVFCERRCALMYVEGLWADNRRTVEGRLLHERSHTPDFETRDNIRIARGLRLRSLRLGLVGQADVVEFHQGPVNTPGAVLPGLPGLWRPFPVEYRLGLPALDESDYVQLCAQALCLEEMLGVAVPAGAMFYDRPHRREEVVFTSDLRAQTEAATRRLHELLASPSTPPPVYEKKCRSCSFFDLCLPREISRGRSAAQYLNHSIAQVLSDSPADSLSQA
ncbi:MAG: CRISPR-associated protein Cas4 [Armatimonadetes bacterium]|nr:CRISPR-associated protein Cas4 [Armatimonadota bacterium]